MYTRWVLTDKIISGEKKVKGRLELEMLKKRMMNKKRFPTCAKDSLRLIFAIMATRTRRIHSIDIKITFSQGQPNERNIYLLPLVEAEVENTVWELKLVSMVSEIPKITVFECYRAPWYKIPPGSYGILYLLGSYTIS